MATELKLPNLGENIESGDVVNVLVSEGDTIEVQQPILEIETDKAIVEVPAASGGRVKSVHVKEGQKVAVGELILTLAEGDGSGSAEAPKEKQEPKEKQVTPEVGEKVEASEPRAGGSGEEPEPSQRKAGSVVDFTRKTEPVSEQPSLAAVAASPSVRRLAREIGVDIQQVAGSGPQGRISNEDVKAYSRKRHEQLPAVGPGTGPELPPLPDFSRWGEVERQEFSNVRRKTAEHMARSWLTVPHVTQHDECDVSALEAARKQFASRVEAAGGKLTVTAIVIKFVASALKVFPQLNASIDAASEEVIFKKYIHIGVAVDTPRGLLVPVVRNVDQKNVTQIAVELAELAEKARTGKLTLDEMQGGTFTVTNLGGIGGTSFTPIVNWPEVAILGMSRSTIKPVWKDGAFVPRTFLPLSLSYDHRLVDGADAARFLRWLAQALEEPFLLSLEG